MNDLLYEEPEFTSLETYRNQMYMSTQEFYECMQTFKDVLGWKEKNNKDKQNIFKIVFKSKPIKGVVLELVTLNESYF